MLESQNKSILWPIVMKNCKIIIKRFTSFNFKCELLETELFVKGFQKYKLQNQYFSATSSSNRQPTSIASKGVNIDSVLGSGLPFSLIFYFLPCQYIKPFPFFPLQLMTRASDSVRVRVFLQRRILFKFNFFLSTQTKRLTQIQTFHAF